jgi:hypothetical protein
MSIVHENIFSFKTQLCLLCFFFLFSGINAQENSVRDTVITPNDSAVSVEEADTNYSQINYFDQKASMADSIELRQVPPRIIDSLKKDDAFWYADHLFEKKHEKEKEFKIRKPPAQWMNMTTLIIIVVLFLGILLWYLLQNNIISAKQAFITKKKEEGNTSENIFAIDYQQEIEKAIHAADYRLATRLLFLRLLKNLSQKKIIQYKQEKTNFDYLSQLYSTAYYRDFFRLARNYEYAWYGKFDVSKETFSVIKNEFENFDRKLS